MEEQECGVVMMRGMRLGLRYLMIDRIQNTFTQQLYTVM